MRKQIFTVIVGGLLAVAAVGGALEQGGGAGGGGAGGGGAGGGGGAVPGGAGAARTGRRSSRYRPFGNGCTGQFFLSLSGQSRHFRSSSVGQHEQRRRYVKDAQRVRLGPQDTKSPVNMSSSWGFSRHQRATVHPPYQQITNVEPAVTR